MDTPTELSAKLHYLENKELHKIREKLLSTNPDEIHSYFQSFRQIRKDLLSEVDVLKEQSVLYENVLLNVRSGIESTKKSLEDTKDEVTGVVGCAEETVRKNADLFKKSAPDLLEKVDCLQQLQSQCDLMKIVRKCTNLMNSLTNACNRNDYSFVLKHYSFLKNIQDEFQQFPYEVKLELDRRSQSFDESLVKDLKRALLGIWSRIRFPFEDIVDYRSVHDTLDESVAVLRCIQLVLSDSESSVLPIVFEEFKRRFNFHFYGDKPTNQINKPEWFYSQLALWLSSNLEFFEIYLNPIFNNKIGVVQEFQRYLMELAIQKISDILTHESVLQDKRILSHLIDESVIFEKELYELYDYPNDAPHAISKLCQKEVLDVWLRLEKDTTSIGIDHILSDKLAFESRYKDVDDIDSHLVPNFADAFVILMDSMSERYRAIPDLNIQYQFVKLQLVIIDEFRSRIVQISQEIESPWKSPFPQLMNALRYMIEVFDEWNAAPEFLKLQNIVMMESKSKRFIRRTFDECSDLYEHVWRQQARSINDVFNEAITSKLNFYANIKWFQINIVKPIEVSSLFIPFLQEIKHRLNYILMEFSPDLMLTLEHWINNSIWSTLHHNIISQTSFSYRGAEQMYYDLTNGLIPLLTSLYQKRNFNPVLNQKCVEVLNELRVLKLPSPTAILLKDELQRIPDQMLEDKLAPFDITGISKERMFELFNHRCDMLMP